MKTLFHGTTKQNFDLILQNGFRPECMVWNCSDDSVTYFHDLSKSEEPEEEIECQRQRMITDAFSSAQIAAAVQGFSGSELIVLEVEIEDNYVNDDFSCENMAYRASCVNNEDLNEFGKIVSIHTRNNYNPSLRFFYIAGLVCDNDWINTGELSRLEIEACKVIGKSGFYIDEFMEFDYETKQLETA